MPPTQSPLIARLFRVFNQLPDEFTIWCTLPRDFADGPDFLVLQECGEGEYKIGLIKACGLSSEQLVEYRQGHLFSNKDCLGSLNEAERALEEWTRMNLPSSLAAFVPQIVVFPKLEEGDMELLASIRETSKLWLNRDELQGTEFVGRIGGLLRRSSADEVVTVRVAFSPESKLPRQFCPSASLPLGSVSTDVDGLLLDYDQEYAAKANLQSNLETEALSRDFSLNLLNGVAGSGKSLIILCRAKLLEKLFPKKSILVLTHNQPLICEMRRRYQNLDGQGRCGGNVKFLTFYQWCRMLWPKSLEWKNPISERARLRVIAEVCVRRKMPQTMSIPTIADEVRWCKDRLIFSVEDYLKADRSGRGYALNEQMRRMIYQIMEEYQGELAKLGRIDWEDIPRELHKQFETNALPYPQYDSILIDEAQFFAPLWFDIIRKSIKANSGSLFIVADPTQGFLKRGNSWLSLGLSVRGRAKKLTRSYRTTRQIMLYAISFYQARVGRGEEEVAEPDLSAMPEGKAPQIAIVRSLQDEVTRTINEVSELINRSISPSQILIIHPDWKVVRNIVQRLRSKFGTAIADEAKQSSGGNAIVVCSLYSVTGLERPIVFLLGSASLIEKEGNPELNPAELKELTINNTRCLYMAMTRAGQRLFMTYVGELPPALRVISAG